MKNLCLLISLTIGISSCGIYRQNVTNVPLFQEKGETQISGNISFTGYDGQIAYSLTDKFALISNLSMTGVKKTIYSSVNYKELNHSFLEIGAGNFKKNTNGMIYEYFLIYGNGVTSEKTTGVNDIEGHTTPYTNYKSGHYNRFLLQLDIGMVEKKIEYAISPRIFLLNFFNINDTQNDSYKTLPRNYLWTDFAGSIKYSPIKYMKIFGQVALTIPITGYKAAYYEASPINYSLGLILNMNVLKDFKQH
jgi:hypothetical protein